MPSFISEGTDVAIAMGQSLYHMDVFDGTAKLRRNAVEAHEFPVDGLE
jgi:hypothetical protein